MSFHPEKLKALKREKQAQIASNSEFLKIMSRLNSVLRGFIIGISPGDNSGYLPKL